MFQISLQKYLIFFIAFVWDKSSYGEEVQFDYFKLVFQWPRTFCELKKAQGLAQCHYVPDFWTVHGFWPAIYNEYDPSYCSDQIFNVADIDQNVRNRMNAIWPILNGNNVGFWQGQWNKHGTCSNMSINDFFSTAVRLFDQFNIKAILSNHDITPSDKTVYHIAEIENTLEKIITRWPSVVKKIRYKNDKDPWLFEVRICFNRLFNVIDCPELPGEYVYYPPVDAPLQLQQQMFNGQNSINFSYSFVILSVILSNV